MKQHLRFLIVLTTMMGMAIIVHAYDAEINGFNYNFTGSHAELVNPSKSDPKGIYVIPESVTYEGKTYKVTTICERAFEYTALLSVTIPTSISKIGKHAFCYCNPIYDNNGNRINKFPKIIVKDIAAWYKIEFGGEIYHISEPNPNSEGWLLYSNDNHEITNLTISESTEKINDYAFANCRSIKTVIIPDCVKYIGNYAFYRCLSLKSVSIGDGVTDIGDYAFSISNYNNWSGYSGMTDSYKELYKGYPTYGLTSLKLGKNIKSIGKNTFNYNKLTSVKLPDGLKTIGYGAFWYGGNISSIVIPNSVTEIGTYAFSDCSIKSIIVGSGVLDVGGGIDAVKIIWLPNTPPKGFASSKSEMTYKSTKYFGETIKEDFIYPLLSSMFEVDGIRYIPLSMSERTCEAIDAVYDESAALTKIGTKVTYRGVTFTVKYVRPYTCCGNTYIKNVELTDLANIEDHVFDGCTNLGSVKLPETVEFLGKSSFQDCSSIKAIIVPAKTTIIKDNTFKGCKSLKEVVLADGKELLNLGFNPFYYDDGSYHYSPAPLFVDCPLDSVYIGRNISYSVKESEAYSPFYRNNSLRSVRITDQETEISENEFYGCTGLKKVWIGNGVIDIHNWAFSDCSSLDYFEFGNSMKNIGKEAFSDCANVTKIISHATTPPVCGTQALDDINKWNCTLYVPDGHIAAYQAADQWKEFLFIDNYSTDIKSNVIHPNSTTPIYKLSGQHLKTPQKGINIINGRKVITK